MIRRLLTISRPRFWMYTFGSYLIGIGAYATITGTVIDHPYVFGWLLYLTFPVNLFVYGINDLEDTDTDAFNVKKGEYEARISTIERKRIIVSIVLSHIVFIPLFLYTGLKEVICITVFILANICYSLKPFRLKAIPFLDSIVNGLFCAAIGLMGYFAAGGEMVDWFVVVAGGLWSAIMHAYSAIPDIEADKKAGIATIATVMGSRGTLWLCAIGYIVAGFILALAGWPYHGLFAIPYLVLIALSFHFLKKSGSLFTIYKAYPVVTLVLGGLIYLLNVLW